MRAFVVVFLLLLSCCSHPSIDLTRPMCVMARGSDNLKYAAMFGIREWLIHLPKDIPRPTFTTRFNDCKNPPIIIYQSSLLKDLGRTQYYQWRWEVYIQSDWVGIHSVPMAHEIGHVLGIWNHVKSPNSIMNENAGPGYVTEEDIVLVCKLHPEIKCR